jgi:hypothetical protein
VRTITARCARSERICFAKERWQDSERIDADDAWQAVVNKATDRS